MEIIKLKDAIEQGNGSVWSNFVNLLNNPWMITAIVLVAIGIALIGVAKPLAKAIRKTEILPNNDPARLTTTLVGIGCVLTGFITILVLTITINTGLA